MSSGRWRTPTSSDRSAHLIVSYSMGRGPRVPSLRRSPWARRGRRPRRARFTEQPVQPETTSVPVIFSGPGTVQMIEYVPSGAVNSTRRDVEAGSSISTPRASITNECRYGSLLSMNTPRSPEVGRDGFRSPLGYISPSALCASTIPSLERTIVSFSEMTAFFTSYSMPGMRPSGMPVARSSMTPLPVRT